MSDRTHANGPLVNQNVVFVLESAESGAPSESRGFITHVGLSEVTASFPTTTGPFTATFAHEWLRPAESPDEWLVTARLAPVDRPSRPA
ncbi:hypothetical protein [Chenggangzhangella methanolivorans]|uniref:Uncharacterized protein n=1 Tax=Chenggangzhangella methanolivorans TaxID=1437009 RepID=A0A9E6RHZ6_9HYPH|nr:hypothetical protein [Chenggangzhangella methanolivorans]QZO01791.1 hypothetical protein K6K41_10765 [Chenggangzhangella methanolivorans]